MLKILYILPKRLISFLFGLIAVIPLPVAIREPVYGWYARRYGVVVEEADKSLKEYPSLQEFFTRDLRPGLRLIGPGVVSPVDGKIVEFGAIDSGTLIQAKSKRYTLGGLLKSSELAKRFASGSYVTLYLAPGDYHHIHAPVAGKISFSTYIPGTLWPVNEESVENVDDLFTKNERITTVIESDYGAFAVVKVGATNVGSIRTSYNEFRANPGHYLFGFRPSIVHKAYEPGIQVEKGERIGSFFLGSTVILISEDVTMLEQLTAGQIQLGKTLE